MDVTIKRLKDLWWVWLLVISIGSGIWQVAIFAADVQKKMSTVEQIQKTQADLADKMFTFTMDLWKIDPDTRKQWSRYPTAPWLRNNGDTLLPCEWVVFQGLDALMRYRVEADTAGEPVLFVDTLYQYRQDDNH